MNNYFLTCPRGLEEITAKQIAKHIQSIPKIDLGGVQFKGNKIDMYKANLYSRTGMHVLKHLYSITVNHQKDLYKKIYALKWKKILSPNKKFAIKTKIKSNIIENTNYLTLKIKDAIVDNIRSEFKKRPSIDKANPDIMLHVILKDNKLKIYIDSSGDPLFKRGYKNKIHKAALNESLAAGIVLLSSWNRKEPLYDIMCGSGTIPIEAAMIAYNIPPGIFRKNFAFQKWDNYDKIEWNNIKIKAQNNINLNNNIPIYGSDYFKKNIELAIQSSKKINLYEKIKLQSLDIKNFKAREKKGVIIINPPYGNRIGDQKIINNLYKQIGDTFKTYCAGFDAYIFTGNLNAIKSIGLRSKKRIILKNGKIDCRLLYYPISSGKFK